MYHQAVHQQRLQCAVALFHLFTSCLVCRSSCCSWDCSSNTDVLPYVCRCLHLLVAQAPLSCAGLQLTWAARMRRRAA